MIPEEEVERTILEQDLEGMGCIGLLQWPWTIKNEEFVREFDMIRVPGEASGAMQHL